MNGYICTKGLTLSGAKYQPGDHVPAEAVLPGRARALVKQGYIARDGEAPVEDLKAKSTDSAKLAALQAEVAALKEKNDALAEELEAAKAAGTEAGPVIIPLTADGGIFEQEAQPASIIQAAAVLQLTVEEAEKAIAEITDPVAVILIHGLDSRKGVKAAAEARGKVLEELDQEGSQAGGDA